MAVVVVGGHSRNIGKTSVVAGLVAALPQLRWTALKITQYGHGFCSANGEPCDCQTDDHTLAVSVERAGGDPETDSGRYLAAGAERALWVRTRVGMLAEAMPRVRQEIAHSTNVIVESNSVLRFLQPDVYLSVLDPATADFKPTALRYLDRADALVMVAGWEEHATAALWPGVSARMLARAPQFRVAPPSYMSPELIRFVHDGIGVEPCCAATQPAAPRSG